MSTRTIEHFFTGKSLEIPPYQRDYAWNAIYVEPPKAQGLQYVLPVLRKKVRADAKRSRGTARYSPLAGHGLGRDCGTVSWIENTSSDGLGGCSATAYVWYRLIVAESLEPVGYCTFSVRVAVDEVEADINEVWLDAQYRGIGLGRVLATKVASIVMSTLEQVDIRLAQARRSGVRLSILVCGDVYSMSGEEFVRHVATALEFETRYAEWFCIETGSIDCDPRW